MLDISLGGKKPKTYSLSKFSAYMYIGRTNINKKYIYICSHPSKIIIIILYFFICRKHRDLLKGFFENARLMVREGGEVHVSHRDDDPYRRWKVVELAKSCGLCLREKVVFNKWDYPGYNNVRGSSICGGDTFPLKQCYAFKLCKM